MARRIPLNPHGRRIKRLVALPVMKRWVSMTTIPPLPGNGEKLRVVDGVGLYVSYLNEVPTDDQIRRTLVFTEKIQVHVEADSIAEALMKFDRDFDGARAGTRGAPALEVRPSEHYSIVLYPECPHMHENKYGSLACGELEPDGLNGVNGGCILDGCDPPENCPIEKFLEENGEPHQSI